MIPLRYGPRRQLDILAFRCRDDTAAADQDACHRALEAAENAADDRPNPGPRADLGHLPAHALALNGLSDRAADRVAAAADGELIEADGHASLAVDASRRVHRADDAAHLGAGGNHHAAVHFEVDNGRRREPIFDL